MRAAGPDRAARHIVNGQGVPVSLPAFGCARHAGEGLTAPSSSLSSSASSSSSRRLVRRFWLLALCQALPLGVYQAWTCVLNLNVGSGQLHMDDQEAGWLGVSMTLSGCLGAVALGMVMDRATGRLKTGIFLLTSLATVGFAFFAPTLAPAASLAPPRRCPPRRRRTLRSLPCRESRLPTAWRPMPK